MDDTAITAAETSVIIGVLGNDERAAGIFIYIPGVGGVSDPAHGGAEVVNDGTAIRYTPDPGFFGTDSFGYTIRDRFGQTDTATVTVTVIPPRIVAKNLSLIHI